MANLILWNPYAKNGDTSNPIRPMGPHALASWITKHGYTVKVIDFCNFMSAQELADITDIYIGSDTLAIGVSTTFWGRGGVVGNVEHTKDKNSYFEPIWVIDARNLLQTKHPNLSWLLGGHNNLVDYYIMKFKWLTIYDRFAENNLLKYLDEKSGKIINRISYDIVDSNTKYLDGLGIMPHEVLPIEMARGCQFTCLMCIYDIGKTKNTYIRKYQHIEDEFLSNYYKYGTTRYIITEETVNESEEKMQALAEIANRLPFKLEWWGFNRLDLIATRPNALETIEQTGLRGAYFGIESFDPRASRIIGKGWNGKKGKDYLLFLKERWESKISWTLSMIVGLPFDTEENIDNTQQWFIDNKMNHWFWFGLYIKNKKHHYTNRHMSKLTPLEMNHEKYGYKFDDPDDDRNWNNGIWTNKKAMEKVKNLSNISRQHTTIDIWQTSELASMGFSTDDILFQKTLWLQNNNELLNIQRKQQVDRYVAFQKSLTGY